MADQDLVVRLGIDTGDFGKGLKEAQSALSKFKTSLNDNLGTFAKYSAAASVAGAAITAHLVNKGIEAISAQDDLARQLSTTVESMVNLTRASELNGVSTQQLSVASKNLAMFMSEASDSGSKQAETMARLGLSVDDLAKIPLDEKIASINEAISANIPLTEQAGVAAEFFGSKAALAMRAIDSDAIAEAAHQAEVLGIALSSIQSAQVEAAGDSLSNFAKAGEGITQQLALQLAPMLDKVGQEFLNMADEAGGVGPMVSKGLEGIITTLGFVADAIDGFVRVGTLVLEPFRFTWNALDLAAQKMGYNLIKLIDMLPGVDLSAQLKKEAENVRIAMDGVESSANNMRDALNEPMASDQFRAWAEEARKASEATAKATVEARNAITGGTGASVNDINAGKEKAKADEEDLQRQREKAEKEIEIARQKAERMALVQEEARQKEYARQSEETASRLDSLNQSYMTEQELLRLKLEEEQILLDDALARRQITEDEWRAYNERAEADHQSKMAAIQAASQRQRMDGISKTLASIGMIMEMGNRKQFEAGKKFAMAAAAVNMWQGISEGVKLGWPAGIPAVAWATATGLQAINSIRSQSFSGGGGGGAVQTTTGPVSYGTPAQQQAPQQQANIYVRGVNPGDMYSGQQLIDIINAAMKNGAMLNV